MAGGGRSAGAPEAPGAGARVLLGTIGAAHGVRGLVKVRSFTADPADLTAYGPLTDANGRVFTLRVMHQVKEQVVVAIEGIADRTAAEGLRGIDLYVDRAALPEPEEEDEFYLADLIGLRAVTEAGASFGTVSAVQDFGAGDVLEIVPAAGGPTVWLPFTREVVPEVDVAARRLVVVPPAEIEVGPEEEAGT